MNTNSHQSGPWLMCRCIWDVSYSVVLAGLHKVEAYTNVVHVVLCMNISLFTSLLF